MPTLQDLYDLLCQQSEPEAKRLATALEIYVSGSLNLFNHKTNVDYKNARVLCFDLKKLGSGLRKIAMHILNDLSNNQVSYNFSCGIATWCYYDEFHVLLQDELTSNYFENAPQKRMCSQRPDPECERPPCQPSDREHF